MVIDSMFIDAPIVSRCLCLVLVFCDAVLSVHSSFPRRESFLIYLIVFPGVL